MTSGCCSASRCWRNSRVTFKLVSVLVIVTLSAPCNILTVYFTSLHPAVGNLTFQSVQEDSQGTNQTFECFEDLKWSNEILDNSKYWIEGVSILIVASIGLFGR